MSYVKLMGDVRWTEADHIERVEAYVRSMVTHTRESVLVRRALGLVFAVLGQVLPEGPQKNLLASVGRPLSPAALAELMAAAQVFLEADELAAQARADSARLDLALDYEEAQAALAALPPPPTADADPDADRRMQLQALVDGASQDTLDLVAQRKAYRESLSPPPQQGPAA